VCKYAFIQTGRQVHVSKREKSGMYFGSLAVDDIPHVLSTCMYICIQHVQYPIPVKKIKEGLLLALMILIDGVHFIFHLINKYLSSIYIHGFTVQKTTACNSYSYSYSRIGVHILRLYMSKKLNTY